MGNKNRKFGKFLEKYIPLELWEKIKSTYNYTSLSELWISLLLSCEIIKEIHEEIKNELGIIEIGFSIDEITQYILYLKEKT